MRPARSSCVLLVLLALAGCERSTPLVAHKRNLALLPLPWRRPSINLADDGEHVTYSVRTIGGYYAVTPRGRGAVYPELGSPLFAPGSDRVYYWAATSRDEHRRLVLVADGATVDTDLTDVGEFVHPRAAARWGVFGRIERPASEPGGAAASQSVIIVDGEERGRYADASLPTFSDDGAHVAWLTRDADGHVVTLVVDGVVARRFETSLVPDPNGPRFERQARVRYLADGRLLVLAPEGDSWTVYRGEERLASYGQSLIPGAMLVFGSPDTPAGIVASSLVIAEHAPTAVWWERMPGAEMRWRVVRDGQAVDGMVCSQYWDTQPPVVSADGAHVAYVCPTPLEPEVPLGRRWVMLDGRRFGTYIESWTLGVAADGSRVAYGAAEVLPVRQWRVFANGIPVTGPHELVWRPRLSPDGTHVFWAVGPEHGRGTIGMDSKPVTRFDDLVYGPEFPTPGVAVWVIRHGRTLSRIEMRY